MLKKRITRDGINIKSPSPVSVNPLTIQLESNNKNKKRREFGPPYYMQTCMEYNTNE